MAGESERARAHHRMLSKPKATLLGSSTRGAAKRAGTSSQALALIMVLWGAHHRNEAKMGFTV